MRRFELTFHHDESAAVLFARLVDPTFLQEQAGALGAVDVEVLETVREPNRARIVVRQSVRVEVPGVLARVIPSTVVTTESNNWESTSEDSHRNTWKVDFSGIPISLKGATTVEQDPGGTLILMQGEIKASIPLIGGKVEALVLDMLTQDAERRDIFLRNPTERGEGV